MASRVSHHFNATGSAPRPKGSNPRSPARVPVRYDGLAAPGYQRLSEVALTTTELRLARTGRIVEVLFIIMEAISKSGVKGWSRIGHATFRLHTFSSYFVLNRFSLLVNQIPDHVANVDSIGS